MSLHTIQKHVLEKKKNVTRDWIYCKSSHPDDISERKIGEKTSGKSRNMYDSTEESMFVKE